MMTNTEPAEEISRGEMLTKLTYAIVRMHADSTGERRAALEGMYTSYPADDGGTAYVINSDLRTILFSTQTHDHLDNMIGLVEDGITGAEALRIALTEASGNAMVSGVL